MPDASTLWQADTLIKIIVGSISGVTALIGIPLVLLQYRKTAVEIKKLRLEAEDLERKQANDAAGFPSITLFKSPHAVVQIANNARLRIPLLVILNFIWAFVIVALSGYALNFLPINGLIPTATHSIIAIVLYLPIIQQVKQAQKSFSHGDDTKSQQCIAEQDGSSHGG